MGSELAVRSRLCERFVFTDLIRSFPPPSFPITPTSSPLCPLVHFHGCFNSNDAAGFLRNDTTAAVTVNCTGYVCDSYRAHVFGYNNASQQRNEHPLLGRAVECIIYTGRKTARIFLSKAYRFIRPRSKHWGIYTMRRYFTSISVSPLRQQVLNSSSYFGSVRKCLFLPS